MRTTIAELVAVLAMDSTKFKKGLTQAETASMKMGKNLSSIGKRMSTMVTLPILAIGGIVTKMAMGFETQMANIFTLMDEGTIHSRDWKKEVLDLSKKVPQSTDVLAKGLYDIVSAGIDAGDAMDVLEVASKAATAGLTDTAVSADAITSVLNAYNLSAEDATDVSDVLFTTIKYGKTTFAELGPAIGKVVATASAAGVPFEEVGAALATMTISGLNTDEAVTSLNQTILSFLKPTDQAKEAAEELGFDLSATKLASEGLGGAMTELSEKLGISVDDMIAMEQAGLSDAEMYDELAIKTGKSSEMMAELFPNIRALKGALILAKDDGNKFNEMLDEQAERAGATTDAFSIMAETTKFQFDLALSSLKAVAIEMGTHLLPIATNLFNKIGEGADAFGELSDSTQKLVINMLALLAIIGPLAFGIGKITIAVNKVKALIPIISGFAAGLGLVTSQLLGIIAIIPVFAKILSNWTNKMFEASQGTIGWGEAMQELVKITMPWEWAKVLNEWTLGLLGVEDATDEVIDTETELTDKIKENTDLIMEWQFANKDLIFILNDLNAMHQIGTLSLEDYDKAVQFLVDSEGTYKGTTEEVLEAVGALGEEHYKAEEAIKAAEEAMSTEEKTAGELNQMLEDGIITQEEYEKATEDATGAIEDQTESVDELRGAFNDLIDVLFDEIDVDNRLQEAKWEVADIQKELNQLVLDGKEGLREYKEKQIELDAANKEIINSFFGIYTNVKKTKEEQEIARQGALEYGAQLVQTGQWGVDAFVELAQEFDLSGQEIIDKADELNVDLKKYFQDAADSGADNFIALVTQFGISTGEIIGFADTMGLEIDDAIRERVIEIEKEEERKEMEKFSNDLNSDFDFATRMRTLTIDKAPAETAMSEFQKMANAALDGIQDEDVTITINTIRNETIRRIYDPFSVPEDQGRHGLLVEAQEGLFASAGNARPVLIHPPEVILNKEQALNVLWNMANQPVGASGGSSVINNYIAIEQANIRDDNDIDMLSEQISRRIYEEDQLRHRGVGIK